MNSSIELVEDFADAIGSGYDAASVRYLRLLDSGLLRHLGTSDRPTGPGVKEIAWLLLAHLCTEDSRECASAAWKYANMRDEGGQFFYHAVCDLLLHKAKSRRGSIGINFTHNTARIELLKNDCVDWFEFTTTGQPVEYTERVSKGIQCAVRDFADIAIRYAKS